MRIARECVRRAHQVRVYTMRWQGEHPAGMELIKVPVSGYLRKTIYQRYAQWVQQHLNKHQVHRLMGFNYLPKPDIYYTADGCYRERLLEHRHFLYRYTPRAQRFLKHEHATSAGTTRLLCLTQRCYDRFQQYYQVPPTRMVLLPPAINYTSWKHNAAYDAAKTRARAQIARALSLPVLAESGTTILVTVGSQMRTKGLDRNIKALYSLSRHTSSQTSPPHLLVVGQKPGWRYMGQIRRLGLEEQVHFITQQDDISTFLLAANLMVHPARWESSGTVLLEAMVHGLPVITSAVCGYAQHIETARAGVVLPLPFLQTRLNQELINVSTDPTRMVQYQRNALEYVQQYDWSPAHATRMAVDEIEL